MKVLFLPNSTIPVKVCNHRYGAKATVSQNTDLYLPPSAVAAEMIGFKHNICPTYFLNAIASNNISGVVASSRCAFGMYFLTAYWFNGSSVTGIPDYSATAWTSAGVNVFQGAVLGASKPARYPNHGQEMYDISGGVYGYDYNTNTVGTNNLQEAKLLSDFLSNQFEDQVGKRPSTISYQNGELGVAPFLVNKYLLGRNSDSTPPVGDGRTAYGYDKKNATYLGYPNVAFDKADRICQASTTRFWDNGKNLAHAIDQVSKTIVNGGWYNDFIHFHSAYNLGTFNTVEDLYASINATIGAEFVWRSGMDEAAEYMFLREGIEKTVANEKNGKVYCFLHVSDLLANNYDKITTNISVEVDLSTSALAGKFIQSNAGQIRSLSVDKYVIDFRLNDLKEGVYSFVLSEAIEGNDYLDFSLPIISTSLNGDVLTVTTDKPTRAVLFSKVDATAYNYQATQRSNDLATTHSFDITGLSAVCVGAITETKQSALITLQ